MLTEPMKFLLCFSTGMTCFVAPMLPLMIWFREPARIPDHLGQGAVTIGLWMTMAWTAFCVFFNEAAIRVALLVFYFPGAMVAKAIRALGF